jgi:hypothetical protein
VGFKQMLVVGPVEHDGCLPPHTAQEEQHIHRLGYFIPEFGGRGQDATRRLPVFAQVKNYLQSVHPVFAPHVSDRNYPCSFDHFFTSVILCYPKYLPGILDGIAVSFEYLDFTPLFCPGEPCAQEARKRSPKRRWVSRAGAPFPSNSC